MLENLTIKILNDHGFLLGNFESKVVTEGSRLKFFSPQNMLLTLIELFALLKLHSLRTEMNFIVHPDSEFDEQKIVSGINKIFYTTDNLFNSFQFTIREKEILELMLSGYTTKEISKKLFISINTVKTHRKNILLKTETDNVTGLNKIFNPVIKHAF